MPSKHARFLCLVLLIVGLLAASSRGAPRVEGYYSVWSGGEHIDQEWHYWSPSHYAEFKFLNNQGENFETFIKLRANSSHDWFQSQYVEYYTPPWIGAEGHLKFRSKKTETILFSRQNHFWINDEPLFNLVSDWKVKNDNNGPQAQGVRFEFWDTKVPTGFFSFLGPIGGTVIYSDDGGTYNWGDGQENVRDGVDSWIIRLRNRNWSNRIEAGVMFLRKDWTNTSSEEDRNRLSLMHNDVLEADLAFFPRDLIDSGLRLGPVDLEQSRLTVEYAVSNTPYAEQFEGVGTDKNRLFGTEIRDVHIGNLTLHGWYHDAGEDFRNYLSSRYDNEQRYNRITKHVEGIYFVPQKAITAKVTYDRERLRLEDDDRVGLKPTDTWYNEVYIEFINGIKGRVAYKSWHGFDREATIFREMNYRDIFAELSVENFLAKVRLQYRLHDYGTFRESSAYGFDMNVNITDRLKGYLRMLDAQDTVESRQTAFAQLKYDLGFGAEFYFEYGDAGQSDNIVWTDWFVNYVDPSDPGRRPDRRLLKNRLSMSFKTWF